MSAAHGAPRRTFRIESAAVIPAPPARVYGIIADYRHGHPRILPEPHFSNLRVEAGGVGAGTRIVFDVKAFGRTRALRGEVSEPAPGRELVERYPETGVVTTFLVEPEGAGSRVTIRSDVPDQGGLKGLFERLALPGFLRRLFATELGHLARVAAEAA